jgi:regulatory protein
MTFAVSPQAYDVATVSLRLAPPVIHRTPDSDAQPDTARANDPAKVREDRYRALRTRALAILTRREHTRAELARKLAAFAESEAEIAPVLDELARRKLLSDERYAEARTVTLERKFGAARIEYELRAKGVPAVIAARAVRAARDSEVERARAAWRKRFGVPPEDALERAKQMRFLRARGFSFDAIRAVVVGRGDDEE